MSKCRGTNFRWSSVALAWVLPLLAMVSTVDVHAGNVKVVSPEPDVVQIAAMIRSREAIEITEGSRIVVAGIRGYEHCQSAVRHALTHRLAENPRFRVLTRDNLPLLIGELDAGWNGRFDTSTVRTVGKFLGASYFVFSDIAYCGESAADSPDNELGFQINIIAFLQVVDAETGHIVLATSSEGVYVPRENPSWPFRESPDDPVPVVGSGIERGRPTVMQRVGKGLQSVGKATGKIKNITNVLPNLGRGLSSETDDGLDTVDTVDALAKAFGEDGTPRGAVSDVSKSLGAEPTDYQVLRASEDMASRFADRFFRRTMWQALEMWRDDEWVFGQSVRLVQLGQCGRAAELMGGVAAPELASMPEQAVGRYLHNYGVALMCDNQPDRALGKLQAAYQVGYNMTTLRMIGVATRLVEWALDVQVNEEPELEMLLQRNP